MKEEKEKVSSTLKELEKYQRQLKHKSFFTLTHTNRKKNLFVFVAQV